MLPVFPPKKLEMILLTDITTGTVVMFLHDMKKHFGQFLHHDSSVLQVSSSERHIEFEVIVLQCSTVRKICPKKH